MHALRTNEVHGVVILLPIFKLLLQEVQLSVWSACASHQSKHSDDCFLFRASTASNIAQKAAVHKAESILRQAVEKAEMAVEEAKAAERRAAESAAHAVAHEGVSSSQAEVSEQVWPLLLFKPSTVKSFLYPHCTVSLYLLTLLLT